MSYSVNVRTIAETYYEGGDLSMSAGAIDRMQEGLTGHLMQQNTYSKDFRAEVPVKLTETIDGIELTVQGRVDGLMLKGDSCLVEEIKTTRLPPALIHIDDYPVHWAQAEIYAYILSKLNGLKECALRLVYLNLTGERAEFMRVHDAQVLSERFSKYVRVYVERLKKRISWLDVSLPSVRNTGFPFDSFRDGQREMAAAVYRAIRSKTKLLCEAPTGIGKTAAALFPAIKALGEGLSDTVFYLTARGTGRIAAENTLKLMRQKGFSVRSVSISAKRKLCPTPDRRCDPEFCPRARGHFDRQKHAVSESWNESAFDEAKIRLLADKYNLCPFELCLALSETAQVIICDYNYVFDPAVRLKRFFDKSGRYTLLIDEAHNLIDRAREMYSAEIGYNETRTLRTNVGKALGKRSELYIALTEVILSLDKADEPELRSELPSKLIDTLKRFMDAAKSVLSSGGELGEMLIDVYFKSAAFLRASNDFDEESYKLMLTPEGKRNRVRLWCWNPTPLLAKTMKRMCGTALFSATLSPMEHYAALFSFSGDADKLLALASPFPRENLLCLRMDIPTRYSVRNESALSVAKAIHALALSKTGNYLACFPSHGYLNLVYEYFLSLEPRVETLKQQSEMSEKARLEYLNAFREDPENSMVAFIAMGGVFSEGIDLPGSRLIGAAIVGVGLPQINFENNALKQLYDDDAGEGGFQTAYVYPGMGKCLQAAGRVIRTSSDVGAVLFIDERYSSEEYLSLFPPHMKPKAVDIGRLARELRKFWDRH